MTGECPYLSQLLLICDWWQRARLPGWCWIIRSSWFSYSSTDRANLSIDLGNNALLAWVKGAWAEYSRSPKLQQVRRGKPGGFPARQTEGFRKCDLWSGDLVVSQTWSIKLKARALGGMAISGRLMAVSLARSLGGFPWGTLSQQFDWLFTQCERGTKYAQDVYTWWSRFYNAILLASSRGCFWNRQTVC